MTVPKTKTPTVCDGTEPVRLARCIRELGAEEVARRMSLHRVTVLSYAMNLPRQIGTDYAVAARLPDLEASLSEKRSA